jgi:chromate transporter
MSDPNPKNGSNGEQTRPPTDSLGKLFLRFLRFGFLAWGGPVAQIDMIRQEIVEEERWITMERFRRLLAIYQVLPGPEAHELCVHFGMLARGRIGGILAGLGFMLPGFVLMLVLSWLYLRFGLADTIFQAVFRGVQPAVIALIFRACHRIGKHSITDRPLWAIAILAGCGDLLGVTFWISLPLAGLAYLFCSRKKFVWSIALGAVFLAGAITYSSVMVGQNESAQISQRAEEGALRQTGKSSSSDLFVSGLKSGMLTFGGAYTVISFLEQDAVEKGKWMTRTDFLDGLALSGILPAPLIIFSTFVGYFGGGAMGALAMTIGIFLPAFSFSLLFYRHLEAVVENPWLHSFLEGVTAGVVGLIVATLIGLAQAAITDWRTLAIFLAALVPLYLWKSRASIPVLILSAGLLGLLLFRQ